MYVSSTVATEMLEIRVYSATNFREHSHGRVDSGRPGTG